MGVFKTPKSQCVFVCLCLYKDVCNMYIAVCSLFKKSEGINVMFLVTYAAGAKIMSWPARITFMQVILRS
jgi:hypothetical protein